MSAMTEPTPTRPLAPAPRPPRRPSRAAIGLALARPRRPPSAGWLARRNRAIRLAKFILPGLALGLLSMLAVWPRIGGLGGDSRLDFKAAIPGVHGDTVFGARYHGVDQQNRPYMLTAAVARRVASGRIDLTAPAGKLIVSSGDVVTLAARRGVYRDARHTLDLSRDVTLRRADGTTLRTSSAAIDLHRGVAAGAAPVRATGPFGTLRAQGGFTLLDKGADIQFAGPAKLVLNGVGR